MTVRGVAVLAAGLLILVALGGPTLAAPGQQAPPEDLAPMTSSVSPVVWQACRGVGLAVGLIAVGGTLAGIPPDVSVPLNDLIGQVGGPVLSLFFSVCQQFPLPEDPPDCAFDAQVPALPSLGRPVLFAALLASELRALDESLTGVGLPLQGALGRAADDLLACSEGRNPEAQPPAAEPTPATGGGYVPLAPTGGSESTSALDGGSSTPGGAPPPVAVPTGGTDGVALGVAQPASNGGHDDASGVAVALLSVAAAALAAWAYAGRAGSGRAVDGVEGAA